MRQYCSTIVFLYLETSVSFDMGNYSVDEADGTVQVTLKLTKRLSFNSSLQLITINDTASELYSVYVAKCCG